MALDSAEVRSFGTATIYVGEVGATEPANLAAAPNSEWFEVGHITDAGPRFSFGKTRTPFRSMQSYPDPVRILKGESISTVSFDLLQWNAENLAYALGGGTWTDEGTYSKFVPADASEDMERALLIDALDGDYKYRWLFRRTESQAPVEFAYTPTALAPLPVQAVVLAKPAGTDSAWELWTDDPEIDLGS